MRALLFPNGFQIVGGQPLVSYFAPLKRFPYLTRNILLLSAVSMFNDVGSEMLIPIMPLYFSEIGFSTVLIGFLEGVAEAIAAFAKLYFGRLSDQHGQRKPFVFWGYLLSAFSKTAIGLSTLPALVLAARSGDKLGKGLRTAARDAMLADESEVENRGKVFGFHRAADTFGAIIGPGIAVLWLISNPGSFKELFMFALLPGLLASGLFLLIKEKKRIAVGSKKIVISFKSMFGYFGKASRGYRQLTFCLLLFTFFNSSDAFLLLFAKQQGVSVVNIILIYIGYNIVFALAAFPAGILADRLGMKRIFLLGLAVFAMAYLCIAFSTSLWTLLFGFALYGLFPALTDGVSKAWLTQLIPAHEKATGLGFFGMASGLCLLVASIFTGFLWDRFGASTALIVCASGAICSGLVLAIFAKKNT